MNDGVSMVSGSQLRALGLYKRFWYAGWALFVVAALAWGYTFSIAQGRKESLDALAQSRISLAEMQQEQQHLMQVLADKQESQIRFGKLLLTWAEYIEERTSLVNENKKPIVASTATRLSR
jgi:hypothetical protein